MQRYPECCCVRTPVLFSGYIPHHHVSHAWLLRRLWALSMQRGTFFRSTKHHYLWAFSKEPVDQQQCFSVYHRYWIVLMATLPCLLTFSNVFWQRLAFQSRTEKRLQYKFRPAGFCLVISMTLKHSQCLQQMQTRHPSVQSRATSPFICPDFWVCLTWYKIFSSILSLIVLTEAPAVQTLIMSLLWSLVCHLVLWKLKCHSGNLQTFFYQTDAANWLWTKTDWTL